MAHKGRVLLLFIFILNLVGISISLASPEDFGFPRLGDIKSLDSSSSHDDPYDDHDDPDDDHDLDDDHDDDHDDDIDDDFDDMDDHD